MSKARAVSGDLFGEESQPKIPKSSMLGAPRLRKAVRDQGLICTDSLDDRIEEDHTVRTVWSFVFAAFTA